MAWEGGVWGGGEVQTGSRALPQSRKGGEYLSQPLVPKRPEFEFWLSHLLRDHRQVISPLWAWFPITEAVGHLAGWDTWLAGSW